jgi:putative addiction module component (TIGR02574 family)
MPPASQWLLIFLVSAAILGCSNAPTKDESGWIGYTEKGIASVRRSEPFSSSGQNYFEEYDPGMDINLKQLPVEDRIRIVEDLWDSIASDQNALPLTSEQMAELDRRLDAYETDGNLGRPAADIISELRKRL